MKKIKIVSTALVMLALLPALRAQTVLVDWTFDNASNTPPIYHPAPSAGVDLATAVAATVGMTNDFTSPASVGAPDVIANPAVNADSTPSLPDAWRIRSTGTGVGNGWDSLAPIGTQGTVFYASTLGYENIQLTFDITATTQGEGLLQVEYTVDGTNWSNAPLSYAANPAMVLTNTTPGTITPTATNGIVVGTYFNMTTNIGTGKYVQYWYTNVTANLSGIPAVNNNSNFAVRVVNAATGTNCVNATGGALNNTSGNWSIDNVQITGAPPLPITVWDFDNTTTYPQTVLYNSPVPSYGSGLAIALGMDNSYNGVVSLTSCDITSTPGASTGLNSSAWRVRGGGGTYATIGAPNGWSTEAPLGTQGAEFDASTLGYANIQLAFDIYYTSAAPAQTAVEYTTDGTDWTNAATLAYAANPAYIVTNSTDPNTVTGTYFSQTGGSTFYTNITATFPAAAADNPNFGVRIVNATTGASEVTSAGAPYNNSSGNWRYDNIIISGTATGGGLSLAPTLTPAAGVAVTNTSFSITIPGGFPTWSSAITNITVGGVTLLTPTFTNGISISSTQLIFSTSASIAYQTAGTLSIVIEATGFTHDTVAQYIAPGPAVQMVLSSQPVAPSGDGGTLITQPALAFADEYGNAATNTSGTATATANGSWTLGGGTTVAAVNGAVSFTNLSAASGSGYAGATITFTTTAGFPSITSSSFNIPAPATAFTLGNLAVEQEDLVTKNSTFSILELSPTVGNQTTPVNTFPISATGTNGLRQSSSGSTGRLADSDDGTLVCFSAGLCGDSTVADVTTVNSRGAGTLNQQGDFTLQATYSGYGGTTADQARSAVSVDDLTWYMGDKGGVYTNFNTTNDAYIPYSTGNPANVRSLKSFGGTIFALQQEGGTDPDSTVLAIVPFPAGATNTPIPGAPGNGLQFLFPLEGFPTDGTVLDFYLLRSGNNGPYYDTAYYIDGTNTSSGAIYKYYFTGTNNLDPSTGEQIWVSAGQSWPTPNGGDGLCARTNANGGVDLFYTTGSGGSAGNSVVMVHDSSAWNQPINLTATNLLYTVGANTTLKGIAFAPSSNSSGSGGTVTLPLRFTPGSFHLAITGSGAGATVNSSFSFTNAPGLTFSVLGTNNLTAPISTWPVVGTVTDNPPGSGQYQFTDPSPATNGAEYYSLRYP